MMKNLNQPWFICLLIVTLVFASCSSERRATGKGCGCGIHKGYVGY